MAGRPAARRVLHAQRNAAAVRELERVGEQVGDDLLQPLAVGLDRQRQFRIDRDVEFQPLVGRHLAEGAVDVVLNVGEALRRDVQRHGARLDLREIQDVVDQREQLRARRVDGARELDLLRREIAADVVGQEARQDQQAVERRAQLVRHVGEELRFRFAGALGLDLGAHQLRLDALALGEIARHLGEAEQPAGVVAHRGNDDARPEARAVFAQPPALLLEAALARRHLQLPLRLAALDLLRRVEAREMLADDLGGGVALDALRAGVPARDAALGIEHEDGVVDDALHHQPEAPLAVGEQARALEHPQLELIARRFQLGEDRAQHESGHHHRADEDEEQEQRLVARQVGERAGVAAQRVPERHGADRGARRGDLALAEAEGRPDDERHHHERAAEAAAEHHLARGEQQHGEDQRFGELWPGPGDAGHGPAQHQRREDQHAAGIALPPGPPVRDEIGCLQRIDGRERQQGNGRSDDRAAGDQADEDQHLVHAHEAARHAEMTPHQRGDGEGLQTAAGGDHRRAEERAFDGQVGGEAAEPYARPEALVPQEQRRERDPRGRPDRRGVARRDRHEQRQLGRGEIDGGEKRYLCCAVHAASLTRAPDPLAGRSPPRGQPRSAPGPR